MTAASRIPGAALARALERLGVVEGLSDSTERSAGAGPRILALAAKVNPPRWGRAFGAELARFVARCPIDGDTDPWVRENVLPALEGWAQTHSTYEEMLEGLFAFCATWGRSDEAEVVAHGAVPVVTGLLQDMFVARPAPEREVPFAMFDVATALRLRGHDPTDVGDYLGRHRLTVPVAGGPHDPLHEAAAAAVCWRHLTADTA